MTARSIIFGVSFLLLGFSNKAVPAPYDIIVIGEEHGNDAYHKEISNSLMDLHKLGYRVFAVEQPHDLTPEANLFIRGKKSLNDQVANEALWLLFAKLKGIKVVGSFPPKKAPFERGDRIVASLDLLTQASCLGFDTLLADMPTHMIKNYIHQYRPTGLKDDDRRSFSKMLGGVYGTLGARNGYMTKNLTKGTILIVGRAHTGETPLCVEVLLRERGMSVLSIDLVGEDVGRHESPAENADVAKTPRELRAEGGIGGVIRSMLNNGFCGYRGEMLTSQGAAGRR